MSNAVSICNQALMRMGADSINAVDGSDHSVNAKYCATFYGDTVREVIALHDWSWATARRQLGPLSTENLTRFEYKYELNTDIITVLTLIDEDGNDLGVDYEVEKGCLYTDISPCLVKYLSDNVSEEEFSPDFVEMLVLKLASKIAYPITNEQKLEVKFLQLYEGYLRRVMGNDTFKKKNRPRGKFTWGE